MKIKRDKIKFTVRLTEDEFKLIDMVLYGFAEPEAEITLDQLNEKQKNMLTDICERFGCHVGYLP